MNDLRPEMLNPEFLLEHIRRDTKFDADLLEKIISEWKRYKATGMEPDMVVKTAELAFFVHENGLDRLRELLAAEMDGRLVVLPCKVGDTVWVNFSISGSYLREKDKPFECKVIFVCLNSTHCGGFINFEYQKGGHQFQLDFDKIGKTVFITREEAEAALRGEER